MSTNYHLTKNDSTSYSTGYEVFLSRTNFREVILKQFTHSLISNLSNKKSLKILDVGCGNGEMTKKYVSALKSAGVTVSYIHLLEPSKSALEVAEIRFQNSLTPSVGHNTTLDSFLGSNTENSFDLIIASYVFYHLNPESVEGLIARLSPKGTLVIMMGGQNHPLRSNPILKDLSKHGDSFNLKEVLASSKGLSIKIDSLTTNLNISELSKDGVVNEDGKKFFSFIYNHELDLFTPQQLDALTETISEINERDGGIAHPTHEIIWVSPK